MDKEKNFVSAVVYVYRAQDRIKEFLERLISVLEDNFECAEIICVNDCSPDESHHVIKEVSAHAGRVSISIVNMSCFHGLEMAMNAGVDLAIGDYIYEFDSTVMDYDEEEIMRLYRRAMEGYDIVSASPADKKSMSSRLFYYVFHKFANLTYKLSTESFRILSRRAVNRIGSMNNMIVYRKAIYANCGLKMDNIIYDVRNAGKTGDRRQGAYRRKLAVDSLIVFTDVGYKVSVTMTIGMMLMAIFMVIYTVMIYWKGTPVEGWTTTVLFMSVAFGGLFAILTIVIKYLQILVDLVFRRKQYMFESIEKLTR